MELDLLRSTPDTFSSTIELLADCVMDAGSEVRLLGNSRTGSGPSTNVVASFSKNSLVSERVGECGRSPSLLPDRLFAPASLSSPAGSPCNMRAARVNKFSFLFGLFSSLARSPKCPTLLLVVTSGSRVENVVKASGLIRARMCSERIWAQSS